MTFYISFLDLRCDNVTSKSTLDYGNSPMFHQKNHRDRLGFAR